MASQAPSRSLLQEPCPVPTDEQEVLTPDTIQQLLREAEARLRGTAGSQTEENADDELSLAPKLDNPPKKPCIPKLSASSSLQSYVHEEGDITSVDASRMVSEDQRKLSNLIRPVESLGGAESTNAKKKEKITAGSEWFDLPKTDLSTDLKRDLQLLRMRSVLDPKRHYKKENGKAKPPEFSHVGTLVEGPTEFFSSRIAKKDRKRTFVDETLASEETNSRFKDKYTQIQAKKTSGKKDFYKSLRAKRKSGSKRFG